MIIPILLLLSIGSASLFYTSFIMEYISDTISIKTQFTISIFSCILLLLDNWNLLQDLETVKPLENQEHIQIIGSQAIELQRNKMIIYELTKIKEHIIKPKNEKQFIKRHFSSSF